ncbi:MAG TPA: response regulator, partial [Polyangiaceae bacterium]|nr:response regulator [Polyangiaceae bacterium]
NLPEMSGPETTKAIRRRSSAPRRLPIVCMTAHTFREQDAVWRAADMDGLLQKPFGIGELKAVLARWLPALHTDAGAS